MSKARQDPYPAFNYLIDIGKLTAGGFSEVSGLDVEVQPIDYRNGDEDFIARKLPGIKKVPNIVLKRGIIGDLELFKWLYQGMIGKVDRREGAIVLRDEQRNEVMRWKFTRGWACKLAGPSLKGDGNAIAIESLEIAHESLEIVTP
jgi:phage tail-like protein